MRALTTFPLNMLVLLALSSCSSTRDISSNPNAMTDFVVGHVYRLRQPAFLAAGALHQRSASDSEAILKPGTRLTVRKIEVFREPMTGTVTDVFAEIGDGEQMGHVVKLTWI